MEARETFTEIIEIADRAAGGYEKEIDGSIESYADWVISWYKTSDCPEPIKSNPYHQYLLKEYASTIKSQLIYILERVN